MMKSNRVDKHSTQRNTSTDERLIDRDIYYPVCWKFLPKNERNKLCVCNRPLKYHKGETTAKNGKRPEGQEIEESWRNHSVKRSQEAVSGKLINDARYVRFDPKIALDKIIKLLIPDRQCSKPKLLMSIIGGGKDFTFHNDQQTHFINGIVNIATHTDIWIVTNGYKNGLVQLVGHIIDKTKLKESEHEMTAVAICKWGGIQNPTKLIKSRDNESTSQRKPDASKISDDEEEEDDDDEDVKTRKKIKYELDMNHTHYLLLDDAKFGLRDTGRYRTSLCNRIAELRRKENLTVPAVTIVVEGGSATISNIYYDLKVNVPVIIISGTGRVADLFSRWLVYTRDLSRNVKDKQIYGIEELSCELESDHTSVEPIPNPQVPRRSNGITNVHVNLRTYSVDSNANALLKLFSRDKEQLEQDIQKTVSNDENFDEKNQRKNYLKTEIEKLSKQMMYCLQPAVCSNITVFNLNSDDDLAETIFRNIAKSHQKLREERRNESVDHGQNPAERDATEEEQIERDPLLELAMDWDSINIAKEFVFQNTLENIPNPERVFEVALKRNLYTFVYELIKLGFQPARHYFPKHTSTENTTRYEKFIKDMYDEMLNEDKGFKQLKSIIDADIHYEEKKIGTIDGLNVLLRILVGDYMYKLYYNSYQDEENDRIQHGLMKNPIEEEGLNQHQTLRNKDSSASEYSSYTDEDYIMRDLFLWSIFSNRADMAKVFLAHMKHRICPALIATKIFKQYHRNALYGDSKETYKKNTDYFEQYAIDSLNKCDGNDAAKACEIILQQNELYGYVTCLQVAADAEDRSFIATESCVQAMNSIWYDKIHPAVAGYRDTLKILVGFITLGLLAPFVVTYREVEKREKMGEIWKPILKSTGINYSDPYVLEIPRYVRPTFGVNHYIYQFISFHQSLPMKYFSHLIIYIFFLLLFSYVLLFKFSPPTDHIPSIDWTEILAIVLVSSMLFQEIHGFFTQDNITFLGKWRSYFRDLFKIMTWSALILFYIGLIVRFTCAGSEEKFIAARVIMAIDIELWWLRLIEFIIVFKPVGPYLVAIKQMLKDLGFFLIIIAVVMIAYGTASRSMFYYQEANNFTTATNGTIDTSFDGRAVFYNVLRPVYFFLHGKIDTELDNLNNNPNAGGSIATQVLLAFHMLFVNILLINLLIAMFSKRFDKVYDNARNIWHSQQYLFTRQFYARPSVFPPFSLFVDLYKLCRMFVFYIQHNLLNKSADSQVKVFKMIAEDRKRIREWYAFEGASTYEYAHNEVKAAREAMTKPANEKDSPKVDIEETMMGNKKDSNDVLESLREVEKQVTRLNVLIGGLTKKQDEPTKTNTGNGS